MRSGRFATTVRCRTLFKTAWSARSSEITGWLWLAVGVVLILSSFAVLSRSQIGRWVGIVAAAIAAITAMTWMPYYPIWALVYVGLAAMVIYALRVTGVARATDPRGTQGRFHSRPSVDRDVAHAAASCGLMCAREDRWRAKREPVTGRSRPAT